MWRPFRDADARPLPRALWALCAGAFVNRVGWLIAPFMATRLERDGWTPDAIAWTIALYGVGAFGAGLIGGALADRLGPRAVISASLVGGGVIGLAMADFGGRWQVSVAAFALGLVGEAYRPAVNSVVAELVPEAARLRAYQLLAWSANVGFAAGATVFGSAAVGNGRLPFIVDGTTSLCFAAVAWLALHHARSPTVATPIHETPRRAVRRFAARPHTRFALLWMGFLLFLLAYQQHVVVLPRDMLAKAIPAEGYARVMAMNGALCAVGQPLLALLGFRARPLLVVGVLLVGTGLSLHSAAVTLPAFIIAGIFWTAGELTALPAATSVCAALAPPGMRARYLGVLGGAWGIASFVAPLVGTAAFAAWGGQRFWLGALGICVAAALLAVAGTARERTRLVASPQP